MYRPQLLGRRTCFKGMICYTSRALNIFLCMFGIQFIPCKLHASYLERCGSTQPAEQVGQGRFDVGVGQRLDRRNI
jgi:hypothetical protein